MRYAIYGMGGFGREVAPFVYELAMKGQNPDPLPIVFVDDSVFGQEYINGIKVISFNELVSNEHNDRNVIVTIGNGITRKKIENRCRSQGLTIGSVISPTVRNLSNNKIGEGAVICDYVTITANVQIGIGFQGNIYSYIAHDCVIGDYVTFAPSVKCNGNINIEDYAYIGTGAVFAQGENDKPLNIGEGAIVGMGAVVTKSVDPYTVVVGNPAKFLKKIDIK